MYLSVGKKIKADLLTGNAVVLFAYGLSGSGKTFTVFGPDAVDEPEVRGTVQQRRQHTGVSGLYMACCRPKSQDVEKMSYS